MTPTQPAAFTEQTVHSETSEHPGVTQLFALLAYGEVAAFYRLTDEGAEWRPIWRAGSTWRRWPPRR